MALAPLSTMPPSVAQPAMRAGVLAHLLSSTLRADSSDSEEHSSSDDDDRSSAAHEARHSFSPSSHARNLHRPSSSQRLRHQQHISAASNQRPTSASLRCRVVGCTQKQCADGVAGLCIAHAILHLPVQQISSADAPHTLAAYQRKLRRHSKPQHALSPHIDLTTHAAPTGQHRQRQPHSRPSTAASSLVTARFQSHQSYRRYNGHSHSEDERKREEDTKYTTTAKLPEFTHRLPTVADLRQEGLQAFTSASNEAKRSKPNSRNGSRRNTATRGWSATVPVGGSAAVQPVVASSSHSSTTTLFHARRTPAGLTLERSNTAADAVRLLRLAAHSRPHSAAASTSTSLASTIKAASDSSSTSSTFSLASTQRDTSIDPLSPRPLSALSTATVTASPLLLLTPPKHMKVLSAVEEQRLYRADLLARLMQRPPVAQLSAALLERIDRLFSYRPPYTALCSRHIIRTHSEHAAIVSDWWSVWRRMNGWLTVRCDVSELYRKRVLWDECDSVNSRTLRLDEWMVGRLARHSATMQQRSTGQSGTREERESRWRFKTSLVEDEADSCSAANEQPLSIVVLDASPRNAAMAGGQSAKGTPKQRTGSPKEMVPQLALPRLMS